jgi:hypothetical protein
MIVDNLHVIGVTVTPHKTDAPLLVHTDAVLSLAIVRQGLESIARRHAQGLKNRGRMKLFQLARGYPLYILWQFARELPAENLFGFLTLERFNHAESITRFDNNAKRYE